MERRERQPLLIHRGHKAIPGGCRPRIAIVVNRADGNIAHLQHVDETADVIAIRVGCHHHVYIVDVLLSEISDYRGSRRWLPAVNQNVEIVAVMEQDRVALPRVNEGNLERTSSLTI